MSFLGLSVISGGRLQLLLLSLHSWSSVCASFSEPWPPAKTQIAESWSAECSNTVLYLREKKRQEIPKHLTAPVHSKCLKVPTCSNHPFCWYPIASQSKIPHLWSILPSLEPPSSVTWKKLLNASLTPIGPCETRLVPLVMFLGQSVKPTA